MSTAAALLFTIPMPTHRQVRCVCRNANHSSTQRMPRSTGCHVSPAASPLMRQERIFRRFTTSLFARAKGARGHDPTSARAASYALVLPGRWDGCFRRLWFRHDHSQYRDIQYDMQVTVGRSQWIWIIHTTPKSIQGSVQGARRVAILAAEKTIEDGGRGACAS